MSYPQIDDHYQREHDDRVERQRAAQVPASSNEDIVASAKALGFTRAGFDRRVLMIEDVNLPKFVDAVRKTDPDTRQLIKELHDALVQAREALSTLAGMGAPAAIRADRGCEAAIAKALPRLVN